MRSNRHSRTSKETLGSETKTQPVQLVITGGSSELVRRMVRVLEGCPGVAKFVVTSRGPLPKENRPMSDRGLFLNGIDLCVQADLDRLHDFVGNNITGKFHVVHCVGDFPSYKEICAVDLATAERVLESNVLSLHGVATALLPMMVARGGGHMVTCGSHTTAHAYPYMAIFSAAKAAVENFTQSIAHEYGDRRIVANCLALSTLNVACERKLKPQGDHQNWLHPDQVTAMVLSLVSGKLPALNGNVIHLYNYSRSFYDESYLERIGRPPYGNSRLNGDPKASRTRKSGPGTTKTAR